MSIPANVFEICRAFTRKYEGGFVNDPQDPGGATNMGITARTLANYLGRSVTVQEVQNLDPEIADRIYYKFYFEPSNCGMLPPSLAVMVFDAAINSGIYRSVCMMQESLGVPVDGRIGPMTAQIAAGCDLAKVVEAAHGERLAFLRRLPTWPRFGGGWTARVDALRAYALQYV